MNNNHNKSPTTILTSPKISLLKRILQFQPTTKAVKTILYWWLLVIVITTIKLTRGFGIDLDTGSLYGLINLLTTLSQLLLFLLLSLFLIDLLLLKTSSKADCYQLQRDYPKNVAIFKPIEVGILLHFIPENLKGIHKFLYSFIKQRTLNLDVADSYPEQFQALQEQMPLSLQIDTSTEASNVSIGEQAFLAFSKKVVFPLLPIVRGTGYFEQLFIRCYSPMGFFRRRLQITESSVEQQNQPIRVLADFTGLLTDELSAVFERSFDAGIQLLKEQGQGSEFLKLREYSVGDSMRQIDWKASSRQRRLMSKSYEEENDQDIVFLLDCSEQMRHQGQSEQIYERFDKTKTPVLKYFDTVLNAVFFLSYIANKQDDRIGLMTFGGINQGEELFIPPHKGANLLKGLLNKTADLSPTMLTSDYLQAAERLDKSIKKRSLVIVITNTRQEASSELLQGMKMLAKRHQLVFANLTEQPVQDILEMTEMPLNMDDSLLYHSLCSYEQTRAKLHNQIKMQTGATCLTTTANRLPIMLTHTYMNLRHAR